MKRIHLIALTLATLTVAWSAQPLDGQRRSSPSTAHASFKANPNPSPRPSSALLDANDRVFVDLAAGGGYESILTFINMSNAGSQFTVTFYDDNGNLAALPISNSDGSVSRYTSLDIGLDGNTSIEIVAPNVDNTLTGAWSFLSFRGGSQAIAGVAVVRSRDSNGAVFAESSQPLSNTQDYDLFTTFDNFDGVKSGVIFLNPGNSLTANVRVSAQDATGAEILRDRFQLPPGTRVQLSLVDTYPVLNGSSGKLRITSDTNRMSAIGYRVSPSGAFAYSPIFNWSGMFK